MNLLEALEQVLSRNIFSSRNSKIEKNLSKVRVSSPDTEII
jgi:hypothetical protein